MSRFFTSSGASPTSRSTVQNTTLPPALAAFLCSSLTVTVLSLLAGAIRRMRHAYRSTFDPLWPPFPFFDIHAYYLRFAFRHSAQFFTLPGFAWYYPSGAIYIYAPFYALGYALHSESVVSRVYLSFILLVTLGLLIALGRRLTHAGLQRGRSAIFCTALVLVSWPLYVAWQRGNVEGVVWIITGSGVWAVARRRPLLAAVLFGFAASIKIYPGLFLAMLLVRPSDRRYVLAGVAAFCVATLAALWYLDPNIKESWHYVSTGVSDWTKQFSKTYPNHPYDHSIFAQIHIFVVGPSRDAAYWLHRYYLVAGAAATALAWHIRKLPFANQVLFLSCAAVTLPPVSFDYTLCLIYVPLAILCVLAVRAAQSRVHIRGLSLTLGIMGFVVGPTTFAIWHQIQWGPSTIKCFSLLFLIGFSAIFPFDLPPDSSTEALVPA